MATVHGVKKFLLLFIGDSLQTQLTLRLTTSNVYYYKKIDEFGEKFDANIKEAVRQEGQFMQKSQQSTTLSVQQIEQVTPMTSDSAGSSNIPPSRTTTAVALSSAEPQGQQVIITPMILDSAGPANIPPSGTTRALALTSSELQRQQVAPMILDSAGDAMTIPPSTTTTAVALKSDSGRKLVFDNFDFRQEVHYMTQDHQNVDVHWVTHMAVENRVSGNNLLSNRPVCQINELENGQCLPGRREHHLQRENYITLTERAITEIPCLSFLKGAVTQHIPHPYSKEMSQTSHVVSATKFLFQLEIQEQTLIFLSVIIYQSIAAIKMHIN